MKKFLDFLKKHLVAIVSIITMFIISITSIISCNRKLSAKADYSIYPTTGYSSTLSNQTYKLLIYSNNNLIVDNKYNPLDTNFTLMGSSSDIMLSFTVDTEKFIYNFTQNDNNYTHYYLLTFYFSSPNSNAPIELRVGYGTADDFGTVLWGDTDIPNYFGFGYIFYYPSNVPTTYSTLNVQDKYYTFTLNYSGQSGLVCTGFDITITRSNGGATTRAIDDSFIFRYLTSDQLGILNSYQDGYNQGLLDGFDNGYRDGANYGYKQGSQDGYEQGSQDGYEQGLKDGTDTGYQNGYRDGLEDNNSYQDGYEQGLKDAPNDPLSNIWGIVDGFLDFEVLPNFTFRVMFLCILGLVGIVIVMKVFLGG